VFKCNQKVETTTKHNVPATITNILLLVKVETTTKHNVPATITNILLLVQDVDLDQNDTLEHETMPFQI